MISDHDLIGFDERLRWDKCGKTGKEGEERESSRDEIELADRVRWVKLSHTAMARNVISRAWRGGKKTQIKRLTKVAKIRQKWYQARN